MRFIYFLSFITLFFLILNSCATKKEISFNLVQLKDKYCKDKIYCAIGIGKTYREADQNAKENLASQIYSFVFSEYEKRQIIDVSKGNEILNEKKKNILKTFTNLSLVYIKELKTGKIEGYYYEIISIDPQTAQNVYRKYQKIITALSYVDKIESESDISAIIGLLKDLQKEIETKNIGDYEFYSKKYKKTFSFNFYLNFYLKNVLNSITVVLVPKGIYLLDKNSLNPIKNTKVVIIDSKNNKIVESSNYNGFIRLKRKIEYPVNVYLDFNKFNNIDDFLISRLYKKDNPYIKIYIKTNPDKLYYSITEDKNIIKEGMTPAVVEIKYNRYKNYKIRIFEKDYLPTKRTLNLSRGFDYYIYENVSKLNYGYLDVEVEEDAYLIITSKTGISVLDEGYKQSRFKGKVPVGTYIVTIKNKENPYEYQVVNDEIFVSEGEKIKRRYFKPKNREYFFEREGHGFGLIYSGRTTNKEVKYKCISTWGCGLLGEPDFGIGGTSGIYYKRFKTHTYFGFEAGFGGIEDKNEIYSGNSKPGLYLDLGTGLYFGDSLIVEFGTGIYTFSAEYNDGTYKASLSGAGPYLAGKIGYIFHGKKKNAGIYVGLGYKRVFLGKKQFLDIISFDFGGALFKTRSGYRLPAYTNALKGINYED